MRVNWFFDFLAEYTSEAFKIIVWDSSSDGRALALHARGSGIDARLFHIFIFYLINKFLKKSKKIFKSNIIILYIIIHQDIPLYEHILTLVAYARRERL